MDIRGKEEDQDVIIRATSMPNSFRSRDAFLCEDDFLIPETDLKVLQEDFLGEGATAKVYRGIVRGTQDVAVKVMQKGLSVDEEKQALADLHAVGVFPC